MTMKSLARSSSISVSQEEHIVLPDGNQKEQNRVNLMGLLSAFSILVLGAALQISYGFFQPRALVGVTVCVALCAASLVSPRITLLLPFDGTILSRRLFLIFLAIYFVGGIAFLRFRNPPSVDVLILENDSVHSLLHGVDPYGRDITHQDIYASRAQEMYGPGVVSNGRLRLGFQYPPLTLIWILPGYLLGDVRYSFLLAVALAALVMFYGEPNLNGVLSAILLLFAVNTLFVLRQGWTEPLMVIALSATVTAAKRDQRWLPLFLGLFFASKQYSLLAVPLAALLLPRFSWKEYTRLLVKAGGVATALTLPFFLWDPRGFWWGLMGFHLHVPLRLDALSFSALLGRHGFPPIPEWFVMLAVLAAVIFALTKAPRTPAGFAISLGMVSLVFFVLNKLAFCNYYFFCAGALCLGISSTAYNSGEKLFAVIKVPGLVREPHT